MKTYVIAAIVFLLLAVGVLLVANSAMPDSQAYVLKRFEEKMIMSFKLKSSDKLLYSLFLLDRRLSEMDYVTEKKEYDLFNTTSLRFSTLAGDITQLVLDYNLPSRKDVVNTFTADQTKISGNFLMRKDDKEDWKYIEDAANYLEIYIDKLVKAP